ncbi:hypothetical protein [Paenibacillus hexagrammi]|uniref:Uncharacterized protein n=1 Tax=Paenibacillus hexagrammi TaxID=2908839 RepID=A0ABY3SKJ7_9BACL|nr:hypothetical protein [Paenibacillus sp. YPD9-1]UJF33507.1 hypothetical protein L0M14_29080 [Paenibacillus sp. YPD9-1]
MQLLAQYPVAAEHVMPHIGRPIAAMLPGGDVVYGIVDRVHDGNLVLRPIENVPEASVLALKNNLQAQARKKNLKINQEKARTKAWGYPYGLGWGYGNYGWGLGWWGIWPLFWLTALAVLPFLWW